MAAGQERAQAMDSGPDERGRGMASGEKRRVPRPSPGRRRSLCGCGRAGSRRRAWRPSLRPLGSLILPCRAVRTTAASAGRLGLPVVRQRRPEEPCGLRTRSTRASAAFEHRNLRGLACRRAPRCGSKGCNRRPRPVRRAMRSDVTLGGGKRRRRLPCLRFAQEYRPIPGVRFQESSPTGGGFCDRPAPRLAKHAPGDAPGCRR